MADINDSNLIENPAADRSSELQEAYEADKRLQEVREEELEAAKDYLKVLLDEMAVQNSEIQDRKAESEELRAELLSNREEIEQIRAEQHETNRKKSRTNLWKAFTLVELFLLIGVVVFCIGLIKENKEVLDGNTGNAAHSGSAAGTDGDNTEVTVIPKAPSEYYNDNLQEALRDIDVRAIAPFQATVKQIDGLEYLTFSYGDLSVSYKNEYYTSEMSYRKAVILENEGKRVVLPDSYDLSGNLSGLCPKLTKFDDKEVFIFTEYSAAKSARIPAKIRMISSKTLEEFTPLDLEKSVSAMMNVAWAEDNSDAAEGNVLLNLTTSKAKYRYTLTEADFNEITYNAYALPDIDSHFELNVGTDTNEWSTYVCLGDRYYLGQISGNLGIKNGAAVITNVKFGAFVPINQEDPDKKGIITPYTYPIVDYLTVNGYNGERFFIETSDEIESCAYDWTNLDTSEDNNWKYLGADGQPISIRGIDVSKYQGNIDWKKVAAEGVQFAIVRMGYRGMNEGTPEVDNYFMANMRGALDAGLKVGVYFFSQAVTEAEAIEEAEFVLSAIKDYDVTYPVIFDTERVATFAARANGLSMADRTNFTRIFCDKVRDAGYIPMVYANTKYMLMGLDLEKLPDIERWFAVYSSRITFPYSFNMLQYSESGTIPGVSSNVDLNISFVDYDAETKALREGR